MTVSSQREKEQLTELQLDQLVSCSYPDKTSLTTTLVCPVEASGPVPVLCARPFSVAPHARAHSRPARTAAAGERAERISRRSETLLARSRPPMGAGASSRKGGDAYEAAEAEAEAGGGKRGARLPADATLVAVQLDGEMVKVRRSCARPLVPCCSPLLPARAGIP